MTLCLTNTMTRTKEPIAPASPDHVTMYVCGPTVYNFAHIGNARPAVVFDVLYRLLKRRFGRVVYARNFTDVDDKINAAAKEAGLPISTVTERYIEAYHSDMAALGVLTPDLEPRVTEHVPEIIGMVERLIARGHAYAVDGHVLFHVPSFSAYGALSGRNRDEMIAGARVEVAPFKRDPADFVQGNAEPVGVEAPLRRAPVGGDAPDHDLVGRDGDRLAQAAGAIAQPKSQVKQQDIEAEEAEDRPRTLQQEEGAEADADHDHARHDRDEARPPERAVRPQHRIEEDRRGRSVAAAGLLLRVGGGWLHRARVAVSARSGKAARSGKEQAQIVLLWTLSGPNWRVSG